jgi:hypothetical protein
MLGDLFVRDAFGLYPFDLASPSSHFFVSIASKGLSYTVSLSESTVTDILVSTDYKELAGKHNSWSQSSILSCEAAVL